MGIAGKIQPMTQTEDDQMVEAVLMGQTDAFGGLVRKYEKPIFNLMYRTTGSPETAADLTQDAFLKVFDKLHTYRPGRKFYSWLYALAVNTARDYLRRDRRQPVIADHDPEMTVPSTDGAPGDEDDVQSLLQIMRRLPVRDREAVLMRFREGLKMRPGVPILIIITAAPWHSRRWPVSTPMVISPFAPSKWAR